METALNSKMEGTMGVTISLKREGMWIMIRNFCSVREKIVSIAKNRASGDIMGMTLPLSPHFHF